MARDWSPTPRVTTIPNLDALDASVKTQSVAASTMPSRAQQYNNRPCKMKCNSSTIQGLQNSYYEYDQGP